MQSRKPPCLIATPRQVAPGQSGLLQYVDSLQSGIRVWYSEIAIFADLVTRLRILISVRREHVCIIAIRSHSWKDALPTLLRRDTIKDTR